MSGGRLGRLSGALRAAADPTRLRILKLLEEREVCVCELVQVLGLPQPTVSRHMGVLRRAALVAARREGRWVHYRLSASGAELLRAIGPLLEGDRRLARDREALARAVRLSGTPPRPRTCLERRPGR